MDEKLKQRQSDMTFQMKVLLYRNRKFLAQYRAHAAVDEVKGAAERTRKLLERSAELRMGRKCDDDEDIDEEDDIDEELEAMLDFCKV